MTDKVPTVFPSRHLFSHVPAVPDRQLWAIGMIVVQWGMAEFIRETAVANLIADDEALKGEFKNLRNSEQKTKLWKREVAQKVNEPTRSLQLGLITRYEALNENRDQIIHRLWGGGMEPTSWGAVGSGELTDAGLMRLREEKMKTKSTDARATMRWRLDFAGLRRIGIQMSELNRDLILAFVPIVG
jgi:hypothetical protein